MYYHYFYLYATKKLISLFRLYSSFAISKGIEAAAVERNFQIANKLYYKYVHYLKG